MNHKNQNDSIPAREQMGIMALAGIVDMLLGSDIGNIRHRIESTKYGKRDLKMLQTVSAKIFENVLETVPVPALKRFKRQLEMSKVFVGVPKPTLNRDRDLGWFMSQEDIKTLVAGCYDKCLLCNKTGAAVNECALRQTMKNLPLEDAKFGTIGCDIAERFAEWLLEANANEHAG